MTNTVRASEARGAQTHTDHGRHEHVGDGARGPQSTFSTGPTGWTYRLIREFWDLGDRDDFKHATLKIVGLIAQGSVGLDNPDGERGGESAFSYLSRACRLAALPKPDGSPRPIAVGDAFYRIAARCLLKLIGPERINNALLPGQFGVGSKGGVEPLVHALRALLTEFKILKLDFVNAFNEVERGAVIDEVRATFPELSPFVTWVYGTPSDLLVTMDTFEVERVLSQRGVRQGCPLSPLLFSLVMRVILRQLAERMAPRIVAGLGLAPLSQQEATG